MCDGDQVNAEILGLLAFSGIRVLVLLHSFSEGINGFPQSASRVSIHGGDGGWEEEGKSLEQESGEVGDVGMRAVAYSEFDAQLTSSWECCQTLKPHGGDVSFTTFSRETGLAVA